MESTALHESGTSGVQVHAVTGVAFGLVAQMASDSTGSSGAVVAMPLVASVTSIASGVPGT